MTFVTAFSSPKLSHNDNNVWTTGMLRDCLDAHLGQIVCERWSCGLVPCSGGNATDPIWRVLASSDLISCWTPLKPQHSNPNSNPLANQPWCIDFLTPPTPLIIPHRLPAFLESLMPLKNWCSIHARFFKSSLKHSIRFCGIFSKFKTQFYCISYPKCQIALLKFSSCDNQGLVGCIPISAVAVDLNLKS